MSVDKGKGPVFDPGVCRCCGSMKRCRLLNVEYQCMGQKEVYADMIMDCFGLLMSHLDDKPSARLVCATCVGRLREAAAFRAQVLRCEAAFLQLRMCETEAADKQARLDASAMLEVEIKPEPPDEPGASPRGPDHLDDRDHDLDLNEHMDEPEQPERAECESPADSDDMPLRRRNTRASNGRRPPLDQPPGLDQDRRMSAEDEAELKKHRANIKILLECSNATPIRCFSGFGYKCCYCTEIYTNPNDLKTHTLTKHDVKTRKVLMQRNLLFAFLVRLDITGLKCMLCRAGMDKLNDLIEHLKLKHEKKLHTDVKSHILPFKFDDGLKCVVCAKIFTKFRSLQEHMNVHFRNYICDVCETGYPNKRMLVQHYNMHKTGVFNCEYCTKSFNTEQKKKLHERFVHIYANSNFLNKCGICKERFKCYRTKEHHMLAIHGVSSAVKCQACEKTFKNQRLLTIHVQRDHLMQRPHKCTICDMSFFEKQELKNHSVKHTGSREFRCEICSKEFGRRKTLREHMRVHEERRFRCEECGVGFVQRCSWRGHMRVKHSVVC
ncbi:zinc finger protein 816-like isoform X1 [Cydia pomonella]|uniref:zinc finger protein 816-like isoform X1 n=1 Tax=Cydia pomonella TaxID=82600 RepID=UPI002ADE1CE3|nr:zinc finger protein 816-like isoform X1 [Cydia pomonella]XP_061725553.1 zinc finger protein 816-like isoform X1 [Cydia pomonella]